MRKARGEGHQRRAEILEAAERIFVSGGYEGATIRKIADEVGVSPTALYMHFPDKHAILMEIGIKALGRLTAESQAIAAQAGDAAVRARSILQTHMTFALKNQIAYRIVFCDSAHELSTKGSNARELGEAYYRTLAGIVEELDRDERLKVGSVHATAQVLWAACHGLVSNVILNPGFGYVELDELMKVMLDGLIAGHIAPAKAA